MPKINAIAFKLNCFIKVVGKIEIFDTESSMQNWFCCFITEKDCFFP